jgi:hypothetical protein
MIFSAPQTADVPLHLGDLVSDMLNVSRYGVVVGPGQRGVKVSWWTELASDDHSPTVEEEEIIEVDPLQLILLIKAAQC